MSREARAAAERAEAQRDLARLRERYWSGERIIEESKLEIAWWEHPDADPYAVLELLPGASMTEIAAARRAIARRCHPDVTGQRHATELAMRRMVAANAAFDRLRRALQPV
jgi:DnaJ-class molecular chaperone